MATAAQVAANRQNSQLSTGPTTEEGKAKVSKNAVKTGLTGQTVLLPSDDAELYATQLEVFREHYNPEGHLELERVQSIADAAWRLGRIPGLEAGIFTRGLREFAHLYPEVKDEQTRHNLLVAEVMIAYERQFRNLRTQEGRLRRQREKDEAVLKALQQERIAERNQRMRPAVNAYIAAVDANNSKLFNLADFGFEFTFGQIEARALQSRPNLPNIFSAKFRNEDQLRRRNQAA
jgi:hypothetical protein